MTDTLVGRLRDAGIFGSASWAEVEELCEESAAEIERQGRIIDMHQQQIIDAGEIMKHWQSRALAAESSLSEAVKALEAVMRWASSRCPCANELPNPCTLCGVTVESGEACKAIQGTLPKILSEQIASAIRSRAAVLEQK